jgi:hypothetical protein
MKKMFAFTIAGVPVLFSKFFAAADREVVLAAIPATMRRVVFLDTGVTPVLADTIRVLVERGAEVHIRDHHRGEGRNPEAAEAIEALLGERAKIVSRATAPACAGLVEQGEFAAFVAAYPIDCDGYCPSGPHEHRTPATVIVADPDLDGLTAAMQAAGISYPGMLADADVFDVRPRQSAETLTPLGWTVVRALATLPPFDPSRPEVSEKAKAELFQSFVTAACGELGARIALELRVKAYEAAVTEAERLLTEKVVQPCANVLLADAVGATRFDLSTLSQGMEKRGAVVTVVRKGDGPIAKEHGVQLSLAVARPAQAELDLRTLVPEGTPTGVPAGLLSNVPFLLHCSERTWESVILPALSARFGG